MTKEIETLEGEETFICPICDEEIPVALEIMHYQEHDMAGEISEEKTKEELSDSEKLTLLKGATMGAEIELQKKYGYQVPKSRESFSKMSPEDEEKLWQIRDAMVRYTRVRLGLEKYDPTNYYVAPSPKIDLKDYKVGENVFRIVHYTEEHTKKIEKELGEEAPTSEIAEKVIKGEYDEKPNKIEKLSEENYYLKQAEKLRDLFIAAWEREKEGSRKFNDQTLMLLGREMFLRFKCPLCSYSLWGSDLSKVERYAELAKHFDLAHIKKLKGKATLAVVKRKIAEKELSEEALLEEVKRSQFKIPEGSKLPHAAKDFSPNPEHLTADKSLEKLAKKEIPKDKPRTGIFEIPSDIEVSEGSKRATMKMLKSLGLGEIPDKEDLKEFMAKYEPFYWVGKAGGIHCKICGETFKKGQWAEFWRHIRTEHPKYYKRPSYYRKKYEDEEEEK